MKYILPALVLLSVMGTVTLAVAADAKACKAGKVLNPETGKCVTPRGS